MTATPDRSSRSRPLKLPYDSLTLRAVIAELREALLGGQVQEVRQPAPTEVTLGIRSLGRNCLLLLSADAQHARVHLTASRRANPPTPPSFCMALRKHLENGRIRDIRQGGFDRILELEIGSHDQDSSVILIAELMGKHSNLILVNSEGTILEAAKRISHRVNRVREILPGLSYAPPPEQPDRIDPFLPDAVERFVRELPDISADELKPLSEALGQIYAGISPFLARELAVRAHASSEDIAAGLRAAWAAIFGAAARGDYAPTLVRDADGNPAGAYPFPPAQALTEILTPAALLNEALDEAYTSITSRGRFDSAYNDLRARIERERRWHERQQEAIQRALEEAGHAEEHRQTAEIVLANLWRIAPGDAQVTAQDYYDPDLKERVIALDPRRTAQENADLYFQRYRKGRAAQEKERERGERVAANLQRLLAAEAELTRLGAPEALQSLRSELMSAGLLRDADEREKEQGRSTGPDFQGHKIRRYTAPEGYDIYLGETATANDFLTTRVAAPNDYWLHVRAAASSHVVIRTRGRPDLVPRSVLQRAAAMCALHSSQKHSSLVSVDFTLKKYVRKPRGSAPGAADYEKETTIDVTPED